MSLVRDTHVSEKSLRVLTVVNMYPTTETPTYGGFVATQMEAIARLGPKIEVEFVDGRRHGWKYGEGLLRVSRLARTGRFDVIHAHHGLCGFLCSFQPRPLVVSYWGDDLLGTPSASGGITLKSRVIVLMSRFAALRADAINCESEEMRSRLPRSVNRSIAHVIPNGVDTTRFFPKPREGARRRLGLSGSERLVL